MPTEELSEISEAQAASPAIPGWLWTNSIGEAPADDRDQPVDLHGIVEGLRALLTALGVMSSDAWDLGPPPVTMPSQ
jgi:hypothetical protein